MLENGEIKSQICRSIMMIKFWYACQTTTHKKAKKYKDEQERNVERHVYDVVCEM